MTKLNQKLKRKRRIGVAFAGLFYLLLTTRLFAADVLLSWQANPDTNVVSYRLYYGPKAFVYTNTVDVFGTNYLLTGLNTNSTYHLNVTAVNSYGLESDFNSKELILFQDTLTIVSVRHSLNMLVWSNIFISSNLASQQTEFWSTTISVTNQDKP